MKLLKRAALLTAIFLAIFVVACGSGGDGGSVNPPPPPPPPKFSAASLSGQYAFSMSGTEICTTSTGGQASFFTRVGTFFVDGRGNVTGGLEDVNICTGVETLQFTSGTYAIDADGRGTLRLTNSSGSTNYSIALTTNSQGSIVQMDGTVTANGSFQRQNTGAFSDAAIAGGYVFDFNGVDVSGSGASSVANPASYIGRFDADGNRGILNDLFDSNIGGVLSGQQVFPAGAFYQLDTNGDGTTYGRGTANIAGQDLAFYVVDATRIKFIGTGFPSALVGEAFAQQNVAFTPASLNGSFAFSISGTSTAGPIASAGRFTADGVSTIHSVVTDENDNGTITLLPKGTAGVSGSYTVDSNQLGGGTLTWTDPNISGNFTFIFYLISPTQAVFQETDSNIVSDGQFAAQTTTPITLAGMAGDYTLSWTGFSNSGFEEDFVGQLTLTSSGNFSGLMDSNQFSLTTTTQVTNSAINGSLNLNADGSSANTFTVNETSPVDTFQFTAYVVDQNTVLLIGSHTNGALIFGRLVRQP
jgi:hypothetical protein